MRFDSFTVTDTVTVLLQSCAFTFLAVLSVLVVKAAAIAAMSIKSVQYITNEVQIVQRGTSIPTHSYSISIPSNRH